MDVVQPESLLAPTVQFGKVRVPEIPAEEDARQLFNRISQIAGVGLQRPTYLPSVCMAIWLVVCWFTPSTMSISPPRGQFGPSDSQRNPSVQHSRVQNAGQTEQP